MALEKYKICPACGEHNPPSLLECRKCETDLTGIKVMDSVMEQQEAEAKKDVSDSPSGVGTPVLVRICECGAQNPPQARKCEQCGEDISDIIPSTVMSEEKNFSYKLIAIGDDFSMDIDRPEIVIGREAELQDYLGSKVYVSRRHAKILMNDEKVTIENLSNTNRTFVNNNQISNTDPTVLSDGDEIGLGGMEIDGERQKDAAYFIFHTKS